ncbi:MAG: hypothetical protein M3Z23_05310, partial [Acidobacteriota bacterium]|nr:hypothetical protein [Acidobacteriota bacterium]
RVSRPVQTYNIGSGGLLFSTSREMFIGGAVEYLTTLVEANPDRPDAPVRIRCRGTVSRVTRSEPEGVPEFAVAVTIERYEFVKPPVKVDASPCQ